MNKLLLAAALLGAATLSAKSFEGTVKYQMSEGGKPGHAVSMAMKDGKMRTEADEKGHKGVAIMDFKAKQVTILMTEKKKFMVQKLPPPDAAKTASKAKVVLKKSGRSEVIAGFKAEEWTMESENGHGSLWGSTELGGFLNDLAGQQGQGANIEIPAELKEKGFFPLRVVTDRGGKVHKMEATEVKPGSLDDSLFSVPADYAEMKMPAGGGMNPAAMDKMKAAMEKMTPEQRAMMEKMMKGKAE